MKLQNPVDKFSLVRANFKVGLFLCQVYSESLFTVVGGQVHSLCYLFTLNY